MYKRTNLKMKLTDGSKIRLAFLTIVMWLLGTVLAYGNAANDELFYDAPDSAALKASQEAGQEQEEQDPTIVRSRDVLVNFVLLSEADFVTLNMFDDVYLIAVKDRLERRSATDYTWFGTIAGMEQSQVILVVENGSMAGNITVDGQIYQVRNKGGEIHVIREIDQSAFPEEAPPTEIEAPVEFGLQKSLELELDVDDGSMIDVLVVYTAAAAVAPGIDAEIQLAIDETNQSYANSGITQRVRLVHSEQVVYAESDNIQTDRDRLKHPSDGFMDNVHTLRDTYCADLVSLWRDVHPDYCGIAYIMTTVSPSFEDHGFSVVTRGCATGYYSFGHELAHIMSARHDWYADGTNNSPYTYNHAYVYLPDRWRTIMAYNKECSDSGFNCTRLQYWSNPDETYGGIAMGVPEGDPDATDNRKTLDNTAYTVANFRKHCNFPPVADAGEDQVIECTCQEPGGTTVTLDGTGSTDFEGDDLTYTWTGPFAESPAGGATPTVTLTGGCEGDYVITLVVNDGAEDSDPVNVTITVIDTTAPEITCPAHTIPPLECPADTTPASTGTAIATDDCDDSPTIDYEDDIVPDCGNSEVIIRTWTATDNSGNSDSCVQVIIVEDTTPPVVTLNGDAEVTLECHFDTYTELGATASDDCDPGPIAVTIGGDVVDTDTVGTYVVTYDAVDDCGNHAAQVTRTVEVVDTTPPEVTVGDMALLWPPDHKYNQFKLSDLVVSVLDACAGPLDVDVVGTIISIHSDELENAKGPGDGNTLNDMVILDNSSFKVRSERLMKSNGRVYSITFEVVDPYDNVTVETCSVGVLPNNSSLSPVNGPGAGYTVP